MFSLVQQLQGIKPFPIVGERFVSCLTDNDEPTTSAQRIAAAMILVRKKQGEEFDKRMLAVMDSEYRKVTDLVDLSGISESASRRVLSRLLSRRQVECKHIGQAVGWRKR